ncbi:MAG: BlaI/MecI/CopY family transcriptional regulator [Terracidiphilus sp.]|jgi:predicted transcriptional regulator
MTGRRPGFKSLTPLELKIMQVLWSDGPSNVLNVQRRLIPEDDLAYNTVQTMLNILHRKGRVRRSLAGRAYVYRAAASREKVLGQALRDFVERAFGGSPEALVMSLIKSHQVDLEKIAELSQRLAAQQGGERDE